VFAQTTRLADLQFTKFCVCGIVSFEFQKDRSKNVGAVAVEISCPTELGSVGQEFIMTFCLCYLMLIEMQYFHNLIADVSTPQVQLFDLGAL